MPLTQQALKAIAPACNAALWFPALSKAMSAFSINTTPRQAAFLAQVAHESGEFLRLEESLHYSAQRLVAVWPRRFPNLATAKLYAGKPQPLANLVYANRLGNGPPESGDGFRYRGRGLIQLTGRSNYRAAAAGIGAPLEANPDLLLQPLHAANSAAWFWKTRGCNELADSNAGDDEVEDFERITRLINGGAVGLDDRKRYWLRAKQALA